MLVRICVITYIAFFSPCDVANFHPKMKIRSLSSEVNLNISGALQKKKKKSVAAFSESTQLDERYVLKCKIRPENK